MTAESPLTTEQSLRSIGLATALGLHGLKFAITEKAPTAAEVCLTADELADYVRNGTIPRSQPL